METITITYQGTDYEFNLEDVGISVHNLADDRHVLQAVGEKLSADLNRSYQVLRNGSGINLVPHAVYG